MTERWVKIDNRSTVNIALEVSFNLPSGWRMGQGSHALSTGPTRRCCSHPLAMVRVTVGAEQYSPSRRSRVNRGTVPEPVVG